MAASVIFHHLVQKDVNGVLRYYADEVVEALAGLFYNALLRSVDRALTNPQHFHFLRDPVRRANIPKFPYHFLYRETPHGIRILVLRHHKRHPLFGMRRK
ncbi:type II toxin-antitoxin system RelE/ParE family toxin [Rubritalea profundi]|uniref:Type II toxin-antitoxin system RelE/ParE family toxin n=1 Tax=Rubritalea profundi TaxID=1658618 RepID=A0A2S7U0N7_9BACT|nr:hypothetical protein BSZ32_06245 [Rubritalea profundi]